MFIGIHVIDIKEVSLYYDTNMCLLNYLYMSVAIPCGSLRWRPTSEVRSCSSFHTVCNCWCSFFFSVYRTCNNVGGLARSISVWVIKSDYTLSNKLTFERYDPL
jgi:hypothetical protein